MVDSTALRRAFGTIIFLACAVGPQLMAQQAQQARPATSYDGSYDVVIRNGRVLDGAGNPWIRADVAIRDGRFAKIGFVPERGRVEIEASDKYVSPGWIDMMDQSGSVLLRNPLAENKLMMGVTTAIAGEGGTPVGASKIPSYFQGVYASHIRGEGKEVVQSVNEAITIGEQAGMPVEVFHLKVAYMPGWGVLMDSVRQVVKAARARGVDVAADMYVYTAGGTGKDPPMPLSIWSRKARGA